VLREILALSNCLFTVAENKVTVTGPPDRNIKHDNCSTFFNVTPFSPVEAYRRFAGKYCLHLRGSQIYINLLYNSEQRISEFLRNIGKYLQYYRASNPRK
jgi:hypothetical protein